MKRRDEDPRMAAAVKSDDGFYATFVVSSYSPHIVRWAARLGVTPNQVTATSMLLALAASGAFASGGRAGLLVGAVLVQLAFTADCVDGQLARFTESSSAIGAWLDAVSDRVKEFVIYAGLAVGGVRAGDDGIWLLAACALALQALRHQLAFAYEAHLEADPRPRGPDADPGLSPSAGAPGLPAAGVRTAQALERSWVKWVKRVIALPIGERFALISVTAAVAGPRAVFVALLVWGGAAMAYMSTGRVLRSLAGTHVSAPRRGAAAPARERSAPLAHRLTSYRDDGPLARTLQRAAPRHAHGVALAALACVALAVGFAVDDHRTGSASMIGIGLFIILGSLSGGGRTDTPLAWLVPPLLHAGAYAMVIVTAWRVDAVPVAFVLLTVLAYHDYEVIYLHGAVQLPRPTDLLAGGWDGRTLLLAVASTAGVFSGVALGLAAWTAMLSSIAGIQEVHRLKHEPHQRDL